MRSKATALLVTSLLLLVGSVHAQPSHNDTDDHSDNFVQKQRRPIKIDKGVFAQGSDLAFKNNLVFAGTYQGLGIFKILNRKPFLKQVSFFQCAGGQGDVSVLGDYVYWSVDSTLAGPSCKPEDTQAADNATVAAGDAWEGLRIYDVSDPTRPRWVKSIKTDCGSHTHTLLPGDQTTYVYIESYPISGQNPNCNALTHRKVQIIEVPTANPRQAKLLDTTMDVTPAPGCHDITTFPDRDLMVGACINQSMVWNIADPTAPELLATIENPDIQIHHSTAMTWDGEILVLGDEYAGATGPGGCTGDEESTIGAAWFYDISDPAAPALLGHHALPRVPANADSGDEAQRFRCTNHNFNVIPLRSNKYLLAVSYYMGGIAVVDFTDATNPTEVGHYVHTPGGLSQDTWAAYWYNGRIYTNDHLSLHGIGVYSFKGTTSQATTRFFKGEMNPQVQFEGNLRP
jgi:hypothetical protein